MCHSSGGRGLVRIKSEDALNTTACTTMTTIGAECSNDMSITAAIDSTLTILARRLIAPWFRQFLISVPKTRWSSNQA